MEMNKELLAKAKTAKTAKELSKIAKENNFELDEESAKAYFELLHPQTGEISDEELDNVSGGGCYKGNRLITTLDNYCEECICKKCNAPMKWDSDGHYLICSKCGVSPFCKRCRYCSYEKGLWLCNNPAKMKR